ncbi:MAG: tail fiber domain-containing protein [Candidatus Campbellbacteria bacterium]|nr:tail fiber domain-containing protein [Candidatus Campbellbacteria bacterium]
MKNFIKRPLPFLLVILAGFSLAVTALIAAPPASKYSPGETLDPTCAPGDTNCSVETNDVSSSTTDDLSEGSSNLYYTEARVSANSDVAANTTSRHNALSLGGSLDYLSLTGQTLTLNEIDVGTDTNLTAGSGVSLSSGTLDVDTSGINVGDLNTNFTTGSIPFSNGTNLTQDNTNLFWDDTNDRLGLGTTSPAALLDLAGALSIREMSAPSTAPSGQGRIYFDSSSNTFQVSEDSGSYVDLVNAGGDIAGSDGAVQFNSSGSFGADDANFFWDDTNDRLGLGTSSPSARLHSLSTTEQLRLGYDVSNYLSATVGSTGSTTLALTGTSPEFTFSQLTNFSAGVNVNAETITDFTGTGLTLSTNALTVDQTDLDVGGFSTSLTAGSIPFSDGSNLAQDNANFFWDDGNNRLGIGTAVPNTALDVGGQITVSGNPAILGDNGSLSFTGTTWIRSDSGQGVALRDSANNDVLLAEEDGDVIMNRGNVGIGTTGPGTKLEINDERWEDLGGVKWQQYFGTNSTGEMTSGDGLGIKFGAEGFSGQKAAGIAAVSPNNNYANYMDLTFYTGTESVFTEKMRVDYTGNVGIGTTSPSAKLDVNGATHISGRVGIGTTNTSFGSIEIGNDGSTSGIAFNDGTGTSFRIYRSSNIAHLSRGSTSAIAIDSTADVGIKTASPSYDLEVNGSAAKPGGGSWTDSSDERLKTNIQEVDGALDKLTKLNPVTYEWKNPDLHGNVASAGGFLAQDVREVFPEWVSKHDVDGADADLVGEDGQAYSLQLPFTFNAYVVSSIKELDLKVDSIADMESELGESFLDNLISALEEKVVAVKELIADRISTKEICLRDETGETCIDRDELDRLLEGNSQTGSARNTDSSNNDEGESESNVDDSGGNSEESDGAEGSESPEEEGDSDNGESEEEGNSEDGSGEENEETGLSGEGEEIEDDDGTSEEDGAEEESGNEENTQGSDPETEDESSTQEGGTDGTETTDSTEESSDEESDAEANDSGEESGTSEE